MGHTCSKLKLVNASPSMLVDHGSLNPRGIYTMDTDYDISVVRNLIRKGRLAPFYQGKFRMKHEKYSKLMIVSDEVLGSNEPCANNEISYENECPICFLVLLFLNVKSRHN